MPSDLTVLYTELIADDRKQLEALRDRLTAALTADELAPALADISAPLERLQGRLDALEFGLDELTETGIEDRDLMSFLNQRLTDQIEAGFSQKQLIGFASAITDTQSELLAY